MRLSCALLLTLLFLPQDPTLKDRSKNYKKEEQAWLDRQKKEADERARKLEEMGIIDVVKLGEHGNSARAVDVVFIGDGFTKEEMEEYNKAVDMMAANYNTPPFNAYKGATNLHRINLVSAESGIKVEGKGPDGPLNGRSEKFVGGKLLKVDVQTTIKLVQAAVPEVDHIMAVLNTKGKFLGSANSGVLVKLSTAGGHKRSITIHEFGHNFVTLLDEYVDAKQSGERKPHPSLERVANVTLEKNVYVAKWHHWNIPEDVFKGRSRGTKFELEDNVRCYEGAATFVNNVYRAEENCHMQRGRGKAFCRTCAQTLEMGLLQHFPVLEKVAPFRTHRKVSIRENVEFSVSPVNYPDGMARTHVAWYLDGNRISDKKMKKDGDRYVLTMKGRDIGTGSHLITVMVDVDTKRVHIDQGKLSSSFTWKVDVSAKGPKLRVPRVSMTEPGQELSFTAKSAEGSASGTWTLPHPPEGATFENGEFTWTPGERGEYRLEFVLEEGEARESAFVRVVVGRLKKRNRAPKFLFLPPQKAVVGDRVEFQLEAYDPDKDHVAFLAGDLPIGATFDPNTGSFSWNVRQFQFGAHDLEFEVTDGDKTAKKTIRVEIKGRPLHRGIFRMSDLPAYTDPAEWMLVGLHHPDPGVRGAALERLERAPKVVQMAEVIRLIRDPNADIAKSAMDRLKALMKDRETAPVSFFEERMPLYVWQFVDRPELLAEIDALAGPELKKDIQSIRDYNTDRRKRAPKPPITDKKYK